MADVRLHKQMAATGSYPGVGGGGNYGCKSLAEMNGGDRTHPDQSISHNPTPLGDHERSGPPHVSRGGGKMPATAHSDHGPHYS